MKTKSTLSQHLTDTFQRLIDIGGIEQKMQDSAERNGMNQSISRASKTARKIASTTRQCYEPCGLHTLQTLDLTTPQ